MRHEQLHMVGHHLQPDDRPIVFLAWSTDQLIATGAHRTGQDRAPVFRTQHHVIRQFERTSPTEHHLTCHDQTIPTPPDNQSANKPSPRRLKATTPSRGA